MWGTSTARRETADLSTTLRSGRDDKLVGWPDSAFPGRVRGTADPSASLGMTKERAMAPYKVVAGPRRFASPWVGHKPMAPPVEMTNLCQQLACDPYERRVQSNDHSFMEASPPFVIPSEAEGSAVPRTFPGNAESGHPTNLSSRPERSAVERSAVFYTYRGKSNG